MENILRCWVGWGTSRSSLRHTKDKWANSTNSSKQNASFSSDFGHGDNISLLFTAYCPFQDKLHTVFFKKVFGRLLFVMIWSLSKYSRYFCWPYIRVNFYPTSAPGSYLRSIFFFFCRRITFVNPEDLINTQLISTHLEPWFKNPIAFTSYFIIPATGIAIFSLYDIYECLLICAVILTRSSRQH